MKTITNTISNAALPIFLAFATASFAFVGLATATATGEENGELSDPTVQVFPFEKTFTITAYYSPVEGQQRYIRGSLAADKKLNGNGTHGADGTPVYPGMIAAPKNIPFGTKMHIPGIGTVAVHDRGGAIVPAGHRGQSHDRLDVWMGYGDEGLNRALGWGRRTVTVMVYGIDESIVESIDLAGISPGSAVSPAGGQNGATTSPVAKQFQKDFGYGDENPEIAEIKGKLRDLDYYNGDIDNSFDAGMYRAIVDFQLAKGIVDSENEFGAGYFGPQTRRALETEHGHSGNAAEQMIVPKALALDQDQYGDNVLLAGNGLSFLVADLEPGASGQAVVELQTELAKLHFFGLEPTGYYGEVTAHAVFKFQQSQGLLSDKNSPGAGVFGPQTRSRLSALVNSRIETRRVIASKPEERELLASK